MRGCSLEQWKESLYVCLFLSAFVAIRINEILASPVVPKLSSFLRHWSCFRIVSYLRAPLTVENILTLSSLSNVLSWWKKGALCEKWSYVCQKMFFFFTITSPASILEICNWKWIPFLHMIVINGIKELSGQNFRQLFYHYPKS